MMSNHRLMLQALSLLAASACGGPPHRAREKSPDSVATVDSTVMVVLDDEVKWQLELIDHREQVLPDGRLRAQIRIANRSQSNAHVQVAWSFKDDRNFAVEPSITGPVDFTHPARADFGNDAVMRERAVGC